jgi:hypothetical protein
MPLHRCRGIFVLRNRSTRSAGHGRSDGPRRVGGSAVSGLVLENGAALVRDRVARGLSAVRERSLGEFLLNRVFSHKRCLCRSPPGTSE